MTVQYVGPFEEHAVVVDGHRVPLLTYNEPSADTLARDPHADALVSLTLDGRFGVDIPASHAEAIVTFIANCIAVGMGYACHGTDLNRNPFPRMLEITSVESGEADAGKRLVVSGRPRVTREQFQAMTSEEKRAYRLVLWNEYLADLEAQGLPLPKVPETQEEFDALTSFEEYMKRRNDSSTTGGEDSGK